MKFLTWFQFGLLSATALLWAHTGRGPEAIMLFFGALGWALLALEIKD